MSVDAGLGTGGGRVRRLQGVPDSTPSRTARAAGFATVSLQCCSANAFLPVLPSSLSPPLPPSGTRGGRVLSLPRRPCTNSHSWVRQKQHGQHSAAWLRSMSTARAQREHSKGTCHGVRGASHRPLSLPRPRAHPPVLAPHCTTHPPSCPHFRPPPKTLQAPPWGRCWT